MVNKRDYDITVARIAGDIIAARIAYGVRINYITDTELNGAVDIAHRIAGKVRVTSSLDKREGPVTG